MRPSIYIGLGGTGIRILAAIKKHYEDVYGKGNIPPIVNFLAIDFNLAEINNPELPTSLEEDALLIPYNGSPIQHFAVQEKRGAYNWLFPGNTASLAHRISDGACQVRTTGRFYTEYIIHTIEAALEQRWLQVTHSTYVNENGTPIHCKWIGIYILTSLCGGTGAGSFLNVAELIHRKYSERAHIIGYGVLHGIFRAMDPIGNKVRKVAVNAYSAIKDLDYLMSATPSKPIKFTINGAERVFQVPLFDRFHVIDNLTESGRLVTNLQELCALVGLHTFIRSQILELDVPTPKLGLCTFDIADKTGWVSGMGVMRVVYKGDLLAKIYGCKAAVELIRKIRQEGSDIPQRVFDWMMEARILENEYNDLLIDSIYSVEALGKLRGPKVAIQDSMTENRTTVQNYINTLVDFPEAKILAELQAEKERLLKAELVSILSDEGGVANALKFLQTLRNQLYSCREKMEAEAATMKQQLADKAPVLEKAQQEYENYGGIFFISTNRGRQVRLEVVSTTAKGMLKLALEIKRREAARDIFVHLLNEIQKYHHQLASTDALLGHFGDLYANELETLCRQHSPFYEHDLSALERENVIVNPDEISVAQFVATMDKSLLDLDIETELKSAIDAYVEGLPQAVAYRTKRLIDVIEALDDVAYAQLKYAIETKASSLLRLDNRSQENDGGRKPTELMVHEYMISLYCKGDEKCRLEKDHAFISLATGQAGCKFIPNPCEALRQKMFIFRAEHAFIPYCIEAFDERVVEEYERVIEAYLSGGSTFNPHFDKELFDQMCQEGFSLKPRSASEEPEQ